VTKIDESRAALQQMVLGHLECNENQKLLVTSSSIFHLFGHLCPSLITMVLTYLLLCRPGKYLSLDCEMVGVGIEGEESSLARVSLVNFYGAVIMDEFVRQKERVVDYRTQWSGIRESDMIHGTSHSRLLANRASAHIYF